MSQEIIKPQEPRAMVRLGQAGVQLGTIEEAMRFCKYVVASGLAPKGDNEAAVFVKLQAGLELGFSPMRALAAMAVVNGRLSLMGEALLAKIRQSGVGKVRVYNEGEGDDRAGVMDIERTDTGEKDKVRFTLAEAKKAGLAGKDTYKSYGDDMLVWRAVSRGSKRYFSDVTMGLEVAEVAHEIPPPIPAVQPPETPDPLMAEIAAGAAITIPALPAPAEIIEPPFLTHEDADKAIAADLFDAHEPARKRK